MMMNEILEWSKNKLNKWQQRAICDIIDGRDVNIDEYFKICLDEAVGNFKDMFCFPACGDDNILGKMPRLSLKRISDINNVSALRDGASIEFPEQGVVAIYGDNGSGKSSFARIFKSICRSVGGPEEVYGDIYSDRCDVGCSALIEYLVGDEVRSGAWCSGAIIDDLKNVAVFDSKCASVYVTKENSVAFVPFGIGVVSRLADLCDAVSRMISEESGRIKIEKIEFPVSCSSSSFSKWYREITFATSYEEVDKYVSYDDKAMTRKKYLLQVLKDADPEQAARRARALKVRVERLQECFEGAYKIFGTESVEKLSQLCKELNAARLASEEISQRYFEGAAVPQTGGDEWRILWEAAKKFHGVAYGNSRFPVGADDRVCVLCHQELSDSAADRLVKFEEYVSGEIESKVLRLSKERDIFLAKIVEFERDSRNVFDVLNDIDEDYSGIFGSYTESISVSRETIVGAVQNYDFTCVVPILSCPSDSIVRLLKEISTEISDFEKIANFEGRKELLEECSDLEALEILHINKKSVVDMLDNMKKLHDLGLARDLAKTHSITQMVNSLTEKYLTRKVADAFRKRIKQLLGGDCRVVLVKVKSSKGVSYFKIKLDGMVKAVPVERVLSEGEFRAVALACFIAELDNDLSSSTVIFDDPVSSLDHKIRKNFAKILSEIALKRQTIVFTHDLYFLAQVLSAAKKNGCNTHEVQTKCVDGRYGHIISGTPMSVMSFSERASQIQMMLQASMDAYKINNNIIGETSVCSAAVLFRRLCEHAVENILLGGVVQRFEESVHTNNKHISKYEILKIKKEDLVFIASMMSKYSQYLHDSAVDHDAFVPDPSEVLKDLEELKKWRKEFESRAVHAEHIA